VKLSRHAFVTFWDVHAWGGVLISLVVYAMFVGGTFTVFYGPLKAWQDPPGVATELAAVDAAAARVAAEHGLAGKRVDVALPGTDRAPRARIGFFDGSAYQELDLRDDGALAPRTSRLADVLYHLHILYHEDFPEGFYVAGLFGVAFLVALVSGVVIHLKDLGRQLFRFRPDDRRRTLWSDLHKVLGVWGLPFQLMIALTGATICLAAIVTPHVARPAFGDDARGSTELYGGGDAPEPAGRAIATLPPSELAARARAAVPRLEPWWIQIGPYGDETAQAVVYGDVEGRLSPRVKVRVRARDGAIVGIDDGADDPPAARVMSTFTGLHFGGYGGLGLRVVYALLGLGGCLTIRSGNWIWLTRRARRARRGDRLLARLTLGFGAGMPIAIACMAWANRLLPAEPGRGAAEAWTFFGTLGVAVVGSLAAAPARRSWSRLLALAGVGFTAIPVLSALTQPAHLFNGGGPLGWTVAGVDLGLAVLGVLLLGAALVLARPREAVPC